MWTNNVNVTRTYSTSHTQNSWAVLSGISGWKKISTLSVDGVSNCTVLLNAALANNKKVDVYIVSDQIERVVMH